MSLSTLHKAHAAVARRLDGAGHWVAPFGLRAILAWEFFEAGREKLHGDNW
ncbi:MAG: DoxX family protein, partial [Lysobacter sp.]|nr:DoxX family protein [Lysobacter sp.]